VEISDFIDATQKFKSQNSKSISKKFFEEIFEMKRKIFADAQKNEPPQKCGSSFLF